MGRIILADIEKEKPKAGSTDEQAKLKAELSAKAALAINEAGQGLVAADKACQANTPTLQTVYVLVICQAYLQDALAALLEREGSGIIGTD